MAGASRRESLQRSADRTSDKSQRVSSEGRQNQATPAASNAVQHLQRTIGNQAVQRLLSDPADGIGERIRSASGGHPLGGNIQRALEQQLGADLSGVRVHADSQADTLARQVNATAFTSGSDIFFRAGAYNPSSEAGRHTLAHEAVHVVQQAAGPVSGTPTADGIALSSPSDAFERAAETTASTIHFDQGG